MKKMRRAILIVAGLGGVAALSSWRLVKKIDYAMSDAAEPSMDRVIAMTATDTKMAYRAFGATGMKVSEVGFGSWAIGGNAYGNVQRTDSMDALARAEELGCNFVDTAMVYGDAEDVLGAFLQGRRRKWLVATKYSGQKPGLEATLESQLRRLRTDAVDFYQVHWAPGRDEQALYDALYRVKKAGKARAVGVSLKNEQDIDYVLDHTEIDGFQVKFSLLDPYPVLSRLSRLRERRPAVIVRSSLREGFLTGKFTANSTFPDSNDQRSKLTRAEIAALVEAAEQFRFLERETQSMAIAAARYPLSFPEVSTVIMGTKSVAQAQSNYGLVPGAKLSAEALSGIFQRQRALGLHSRRRAILDLLRRLVSS